MSEMNLVWVVSAGFFAIALSCALYMRGGRSHKIIRRLGVALTLGAALNGIAIAVGNWHWQFGLVFLSLFVSTSLGYGGDTTSEKIRRRTVYCLGLFVSHLICGWAVGFGSYTIGLLIYQGIASAGTIWLGVKNPFKTAVLEEGIICLLLTWMLPFWSLVR